MAIEHTPTGVIHKGQNGGTTGCGINTKEHSTHWENANASITCDKKWL